MESLSIGELGTLVAVLVSFILLVLAALTIYVLVSSQRQRTRTPSQPGAADKGIPGGDQAKEPILSLVREKPNGPLQVEIGGTHYRKLADIEDVDEKRRVVKAAMELIQFTGVLGDTVSNPPSLAQTQSWREDLRTDSQAQLAQIQKAQSLRGPAAPSTASKEIEKRFLDLLGDLGRESARPFRSDLVNSIQQSLHPKKSEAEGARTFLDEIDEIIQRRLQLLPGLQDRDLHVRPAPDGAVLFFFEGEAYTSVDQVPSFTARQLINDAIREWEETT
jgi:hypothetical protein